MTNLQSLVRKLSGVDEKAPAPPQTGNDQRSMKHFYGIIAFTIGTILFGIVVAFLGFF